MDCDPPNNNSDNQNSAQLPQSSLISDEDEFQSAKGGSNDDELGLGTSLDPANTALPNGPNEKN